MLYELGCQTRRQIYTNIYIYTQTINVLFYLTFIRKHNIQYHTLIC